MKLKSVKKIRDEWCDSENGSISSESLEHLKKHIEGKDENELRRAISLVTDARLMQFVPLIAKHLDHEDGFIREFTVGCLLGRFFQSQYAARGLQMAKEDPREGARDLAISSLGAIINDVAPKLMQEIADYIYHVITSPDYDMLDKQSAYRSVLKAMYITPMEWPRLKLEPNIEELVDKNLLREFCKKYNVKMNPKRS